MVADATYKTCKRVFRDGHVLSTAYKRPMTMKGGHPGWSYVYDEYYDCVICPEYQPLIYRTTNRDGYREYKSDLKICAHCPPRHLCTRSKNCVKTVKTMRNGLTTLGTPQNQELYAKGKETIERVFADAKEKHAIRYMLYRGLVQGLHMARLKFAAMNLKKLAIWNKRQPPAALPALFFLLFLSL